MVSRKQTFGDASKKVPPPPPKLTLPTGWKETKDGDGDTYYFNEGTGATQWDHPIKRQRVEIPRPPQKPPPKPATIALPPAEALSSQLPCAEHGGCSDVGGGWSDVAPSTFDFELARPGQLPPR